MSVTKAVSLLLLVTLAATLVVAEHEDQKSPLSEKPNGDSLGISKDHPSHPHVTEIQKKIARLIPRLKESETLAKQLLFFDSAALHQETEIVLLLEPLDQKAVELVLKGKDPRQDKEFEKLDELFGKAVEKAIKFRQKGAAAFGKSKTLNQEAQKIEGEIKKLEIELKSQSEKKTPKSEKASQPPKATSPESKISSSSKTSSSESKTATASKTPSAVPKTAASIPKINSSASGKATILGGSHPSPPVHKHPHVESHRHQNKGHKNGDHQSHPHVSDKV